MDIEDIKHRLDSNLTDREVNAITTELVLEVEKLEAKNIVLLIWEKFGTSHGHTDCIKEIQRLQKENGILKEEIEETALDAAGASR